MVGIDVEYEARKALVRVMELLYMNGFNTLKSGNASIRLGDYILITPGGVPKVDLTPKDIVKIDFNGNVIKGVGKPSSEYRMHIEIYKRSGYEAVAHAHPPTTLAVFEKFGKIEFETLEIEYALENRDIAVLPPLPPGSEELAKAVGEAVKKGHDFIVLLKHGVVAVADNIYNALYKIEAVENEAYLFLVKHLLRCGP